MTTLHGVLTLGLLAFVPLSTPWARTTSWLGIPAT